MIPVGMRFPKQRLAPHTAGWRALAVVWLVLVPLWLVVGAMGAARHGVFYIVSLVGWLAVMVVLARTPHCPTCHRSVFTGGTETLSFGRPRPSRTCSRCGRDLTLPPS
jgi:hypothetical protein